MPDNLSVKVLFWFVEASSCSVLGLASPAVSLAGLAALKHSDSDRLSGLIVETTDGSLWGCRAFGSMWAEAVLWFCWMTVGRRGIATLGVVTLWPWSS